MSATANAGFKFNYWEVRGVPVRLEIGLKEVVRTAGDGFSARYLHQEAVSGSELAARLNS